jgi:Flp pilus assembly protein TadD/2-polyprenyl-3-methyl-5-hydroxy-6-metoxy-1,4-benzoquinol methylase
MPAIPALLNDAVRLHQAGRLDQAQALYNQVLAADPRQPDALHLLGMIALQMGQAQAGEELIRKAIAVNRNEASYHFHLAFALQALGRLDEAAASYRRTLQLKPNDPDSYNNLGNVLGAQKKYDEAIASFRRALSIQPDNAGVYNNLGTIYWNMGKLEDAEENYRKAVAIKPDYPDALANLGNVHRERGELDQALSCYGKALAGHPNHAGMHSNLGIALWQLGRRDAAIASYQRALQLDPNIPEALANLGVALWEKGELGDAEVILRRAMAVKPGDPDIVNNISGLLMTKGDGAGAMDMIRRSLEIRETRRAKRQFVELVALSRWSGDNADIRATIIRALTEPWDRPGKLAHASASLIKAGPLGEMIARSNQAWPERLSAAALLGPEGFAAPAADALLNALLTSAPNTDMEIERFLTLARTAMAEADDSAAALVFLAALAQQCFINEYLFLPTGDEEAEAETLRAEISRALESGKEIVPRELLRAASYAPLYALPQAEKLLERKWPGPVEAVLTQQVREPLTERKLAGAIPRLTPINDAISRAVQEQYEENPYPRWMRVAAGAPDHIARVLSEKFPLADFERQPGRTMNRILIAGCGTGQQSIASALKYGDKEMLAVDLSLTSLAYARRKSEALGLHIEYGQADILELGPALDRNGARRFDLIESIGVLHHMADPFAGWRALLALLDPGGFMWLGFYSEVARQNIVEARARIAQRGLSTTAAEIRRFRQELFDGESGGHFDSVLKSEDFFSVSACRDLIFHTQEHRLTLEQIDRFLKENGLRFLGFELDDAVLNVYRTRYPGDPGATDLANWAAFERDNPGMFAAMYVFWIQKP